MSDLAYFTGIANFKAVVADTPVDVDNVDPDKVGLTGTVTFTPEIENGDLILATDFDPFPTGLYIAPILGCIDTDGFLKLGYVDVDGTVKPRLTPWGEYPYTPLRLVADTPVLELGSALWYRVTFSNMSYNGKFVSIKSFSFQAPNGDIEFDLIRNALPGPGVRATALTKLAPTGVRLDGDQLVFTFGGTDIDDPIPLEAIAATVEVGDVATGEPGTDVTVTNSGTALSAVLDFEIPRGDTGDAATVDVGTVTTGAPGTNVSVVNSGTTGAAVLDFTIPRGVDGEVTLNTTQTLKNKTLDATNTSTQWIKRSVQTVSAPTVLGSTAATDYVVFSKMTEPVALLNCEGSDGSTTFTDSGYLAANWTAAGDAKISTAQSKWGSGSAYFDGTGDYIKPSAPGTSFTFGLSDWTIELWCRPTASAASTKYILDFRPDVAPHPYPMIILNSSNILAYHCLESARITGPTLSDDTWYHVAVSRVSGVTRMFVDGSQVGSSWTDATDYLNPFPTSSTSAVGNGFKGWLQDIRIFNGVGLYSTTFTPPSRLGRSYEDVATAPKTVALLHGNGANASTTITDSGVLLSNWAAYGNAQISTAQSKFGGSSLYLDGTGDYVTPTADSGNFAFGTGDFTIEAWVRFSSTTGTQVLIDGRTNGTASGPQPAVYSNGGLLRYYVNGADRISGSTTLSVDTWYHISVSRASGTTKMFLNGVLEGSSYNDSAVSYTAAASRPVIGGSGASIGTQGVIGHMDEIRISKGLARYTSNFTPPTSPHPDPPAIKLPTAVGNSNRNTVNCIGPQPILLSNANGQTINGSSTYVVVQDESVDCVSTGSNWRLV